MLETKRDRLAAVITIVWLISGAFICYQNNNARYSFENFIEIYILFLVVPFFYYSYLWVIKGKPSLSKRELELIDMLINSKLGISSIPTKEIKDMVKFKLLEATKNDGYKLTEKGRIVTRTNPSPLN